MAGVFTGGISFNGLLHFGWSLSRLLLCYDWRRMQGIRYGQ